MAIIAQSLCWQVKKNIIKFVATLKSNLNSRLPASTWAPCGVATCRMTQLDKVCDAHALRHARVGGATRSKQAKNNSFVDLSLAVRTQLEFFACNFEILLWRNKAYAGWYVTNEGNANIFTVYWSSLYSQRLEIFENDVHSSQVTKSQRRYFSHNIQEDTGTWEGSSAQCKTQTRANMILSFAASISFTSFASQLPRYIFFIGMHLSFSKISWTIKPHLGGVEYEQPPLLIKQRSTGSRRQQPDAGLCADVYFRNKPADEYQHPRWLTRRMFGIA